MARAFAFVGVAEKHTARPRLLRPYTSNAKAMEDSLAQFSIGYLTGVSQPKLEEQRLAEGEEPGSSLLRFNINNLTRLKQTQLFSRSATPDHRLIWGDITGIGLFFV